MDYREAGLALYKEMEQLEKDFQKKKVLRYQSHLKAAERRGLMRAVSWFQTTESTPRVVKIALKALEKKVSRMVEDLE